MYLDNCVDHHDIILKIMKLHFYHAKFRFDTAESEPSKVLHLVSFAILTNKW